MSPEAICIQKAEWYREHAETYGSYVANTPFRLHPMNNSPRTRERDRIAQETVHKNAKIAAHFGLLALDYQRRAGIHRDVAKWAAGELCSTASNDPPALGG